MSTTAMDRRMAPSEAPKRSLRSRPRRWSRKRSCTATAPGIMVHEALNGSSPSGWNRDRRIIPFGEARGKVKFAMIGDEDKNRKAELASSLVKPNDGLNDEERLFRAAVDSGTARNAGIHLYVVNAYLARRKMDRDRLAAEPRGRFQVEILLSE